MGVDFKNFGFKGLAYRLWVEISVPGVRISRFESNIDFMGVDFKI